jgi:hypothetical protein
MATGFIKGALIQYMPTFLVPLPNVIVFQFNPETMTHSWSQPEEAEIEEGGNRNPLAVRGLPGESFTFTLSMDAVEMISSGSEVAKGIAFASGINSRLAALEMLQYPTSTTGQSLLGTVQGLLSSGSGDTTRTVPNTQVAAALFVWGPERIVPVRLTSLSITEQLYDTLLNPTHAEANITLRVLTPQEIEYVTPSAVKEIAKAAYYYSLGERQALAVVNYANAVESILGMLPVGVG